MTSMQQQDPLTYVELFAGAGGMSLGLERAGLACKLHVEIAEFPQRVLRHTWPDVPVFGDVAALSGGRKMKRWLLRQPFAQNVDLLAGGSPCQDLSVAGKRAGITDGARSSLFFRQVRLWKLLRCPYFLWENVAGALSSNAGKDFALVLSSIVGGAVLVPSDGWRSAGVVSGPTGVAAWRLLDAQWFGVPQRRLRVFVLGARAGGVDPAAVLLEPEGMHRNPPARRQARKGAARDSRARAAEARGGLTLSWDDECNPGAEVMGMLRAKESGGHSRAGVVAFNATSSDVEHSEDITPTLQTMGGKSISVLPFDLKTIVKPDNRSAPQPGSPSPTLTMDGGACIVEGEEVIGACEVADSLTVGANQTTGVVGDVVVQGPVAFFDQQRDGVYGENAVASTLSARDYKEATDLIVPLEPVILSSGQANASVHMDGSAPTLATQSDQPILLEYVAEVCNTLDAAFGDKMGLEDQHINAGAPRFPVQAGIPRRLLPVECERLMSWPDNHTNVPDAKGRPASDANRYKAIGNGVVSNVAQWIGERLRLAVSQLEPERS